MIIDNRMGEVLKEAEAIETSRFYRKFYRCLGLMYDIMVQYNEAIARENPDFNGHGMNHSIRILSLCSQLLKDYLKKRSDTSKGADDNQEDTFYNNVFVLASAVLWHDAGMIGGRSNHAIRLMEDEAFGNQIRSCIMTLPEIVQESFVKEILLVAAAHSDDNTFYACEPAKRVNSNNGSSYIYTRSLAAILRLCDELSDDNTRLVEKYKSKKEESEIYWDHSAYITESTIDLNSNSAKITYEIPLDKVDKTYQLFDENRIVHEVNILQFIANRIGRVQQDMNLCCPLFAQIAVIEKLEVNIFIKQEETAKPLVLIKKNNSPALHKKPEYWADTSSSQMLKDYPDLSLDRAKALFTN